jgi:hypothetical protein
VIRILWGKMAERDEDHKISMAILIAGREIAEAILEVAEALVPKATKLTLQYTLEGGTTMGTPVTGTVGQVFDPTVVESNATTPSIQPIGPLVYASDTPASVTVDPNTGIATLVAAGTANVSVIDQGNGLTDTVAFTVTTVTPPVATALSLEYALAAAAKRKK